jgi:RimJ/RimL family protein N-acetyltransferase
MIVPLLKTPRLTLEQPTNRDATLMFETFKIDGFIDGLLYTEPITKSFANKSIARTKQSKTVYKFSIRLQGLAIGSIWIKKFKEHWYIGYWLHPKYQGHGYMAEAIQAVTSFAKTINIRELIADVYPWNTKSKNVLKNLQWSLRGVFISEMNGKIVERFSYSSTQ